MSSTENLSVLMILVYNKKLLIITRLTLFHKIKCHVIPHQHKRSPLGRFRETIASQPLNGLVKRLTGTFSTHKVFVEMLHELRRCFVF